MSTVGIDTLGKKLKYVIGKSRRWWHNRWKYSLVYNENILESFVWLAKNRMNCASFFNCKRNFSLWVVVGIYK